jgi:hypothetical protein
VGDDLARRHAFQALVELRVDRLQQALRAVLPLRDEADDLVLALLAMVDQLLHLAMRVLDRRPVPGQQECGVERLHLLERADVLGHVADDARADAEDVIAGEERVVLFKQHAEMPGGVSGRVNRAQM